MAEPVTLEQALLLLVESLLARYEECVPARGLFPDLSASQPVRHRSSLSGSESEVILEMSIRAMNPEAGEAFDRVRFVCLRARNPRTQGFASATMFHGTKTELHQRLKRMRIDADELLDAARALLEGLPEETNPDLWR